MIESRPFTSNRRLGIKRAFHYDHATDEFTIQTQYQNPAEDNKLIYNMFDERSRWRDGGEVVARIPNTLLLKLHEQGILEDETRFRRWLNDPDNRCFRTRPGRI